MCVEVAPKDISTLTVDAIPAQTATGSALTPAVTVRHGDTVLAAGTDYTVTYENNTAVGTATVTITGMGNYTGTLTATFAIREAEKEEEDEQDESTHRSARARAAGGEPRRWRGRGRHRHRPPRRGGRLCALHRGSDGRGDAGSAPSARW